MGPNLVDLTGLVAVVMVFSIVLVPVIGLTARFAFKPIAESLAKLMSVRGDEETVRLLERRVALLEQQVDAIEHGVQELRHAESFDRQLSGGQPGSQAPPSPPPGQGA